LLELHRHRSPQIEIRATEFSNFAIRKGQRLEYILQPEPQAEIGDILRIRPPNAEFLNVSRDNCSLQEGCEFSVEASGDVDGQIYVGQGLGRKKEVVILDFGDGFNFRH
jgi:hypothetical protein